MQSNFLRSQIFLIFLERDQCFALGHILSVPFHLLSLPDNCKITVLLLMDLFNLKAPKPFFSSILQKFQHSLLKTVHYQFFKVCVSFK